MNRMKAGFQAVFLTYCFFCWQDLWSQTPLLVAKINMLPTKEYNLKQFEKNTLYFYPNATGDEIGSPFLLKQGTDVGICDYVTERVLWLDKSLNIDRVLPLGPLGEPQWGGYFVDTSNPFFVSIYKDTLQSRKDFDTDLGELDKPFGGGAWYQADALFFWNTKGELYAIDHPVDVGPNSTRNNPASAFKNRKEVEEFLLQDTTGRFSGLQWNSRYGLLRNGYPLAKILTNEWRAFLADQRTSSGIVPDKGHQEIPVNWKYGVLASIGQDGALYWGQGSRGGVDVVQNGYIVKEVRFPEGVNWDMKVLPTGDILLAEKNFEKQLYYLYVIKRTW